MQHKNTYISFTQEQTNFSSPLIRKKCFISLLAPASVFARLFLQCFVGVRFTTFLKALGRFKKKIYRVLTLKKFIRVTCDHLDKPNFGKNTIEFSCKQRSWIVKHILSDMTLCCTIAIICIICLFSYSKRPNLTRNRTLRPLENILCQLVTSSVRHLS